METKTRRSAISIMGALIILVKPLLPVMLLAVIAGVIGFLCAIFITVIGGEAVVTVVRTRFPTAASGPALFGLGLAGMAAVIAVMAVLRGILRYAEQYCNHYIAFKLLAIIRHKVFAVLRTLAPAKLEGKDKGNLITLITTDIELLEVFYAHTISPILIAALTSIIMLIFIGSYSLIAVPIALAGYLTVGVIIPLYNGNKTSAKGLAFRTEFGNLNSFVLESLRGLEEIIQYDAGGRTRTELERRSENLAQSGAYLSMREGRQHIAANTAVLLFTFAELFLSIILFQLGKIDFAGVIGITLGMSASFGPVIALAQLSNNLHQTLASGDRILTLLEEQPLIHEIPDDGKKRAFDGLSVDHIDFAYADEPILQDYSAIIQKNTITGIHGVSGSGKSTALKLMMRFWEVQHGAIRISGEDLRTVPTGSLRSLEAYVTQESQLFKGTIADNIKIGKLTASDAEVIDAAKKASIHQFIETLPKGYATPVGELGDTLSGGEKQRIGLARAFLHNAPLLLLDEPTSNLDALNEKVILKSLKESSAGKTVVLVSHRESTLRIADRIISMEPQRSS